MSLQVLRDNALYAYGYLQGRHFSLSGSASQMLGTAVSKVSSLVSLPLPLLSFLALPFFGRTTTTINLIFFYLTWSAMVWSHDPLHVEIYGSLAIRLLFYLLPSLGLLGFDLVLPSLSASIKAVGDKALPATLGQRKLAKIVAWSIFNVFLALALQAGIELLLTSFHLRSALRVSTAVPLPWSIGKDVLRALVVRGLLHYVIHRYVLHGPSRTSPPARWHKSWAHSIQTPFSLCASYDHPINYLLAHFLPLYLPAVIWRFHVLTWHLLLAVTSLETLFIYSGYAVLPSTIILAGMARRTDKHYSTRGKGNYGHWGVMDWACGTSCAGEGSIMEDVQEEADKRDVRGHVGDALGSAEDRLGNAKKKVERGGSDGTKKRVEAVEEEEAEEEEEPPSPPTRKQGGSPTAEKRQRFRGKSRKA